MVGRTNFLCLTLKDCPFLCLGDYEIAIDFALRPPYIFSARSCFKDIELFSKPNEEIPALVPARMLNEFTYCPRLFYLEWVNGQFEDNFYTVDGRFLHRNVDSVDQSHSVMLSSEELGIIARIDFLETDNDSVVPVETKRGAVPENNLGSWEPDRIQLCAQGLVLQNAGYKCTKGEIYYAESKQRVPISFDAALIERTLNLLEELREAAANSKPPKPLVDSNKCPECSLVGICLPDEINGLSERSKRPPRYLLPKTSNAQPIYVTEQGARLGIRAGRLQLSVKNKAVQSLRLLDVSQLNIYGNVQISSQLLRQLFWLDIPVNWFSYGGLFQGTAQGLPAKNVDLRRKQIALSYGADLDIARSIVAGKIRNCRTLLRRNSNKDHSSTLATLKKMSVQAQQAETLGSLLGYEGSAARAYFQAFPDLLKKNDDTGTFDFNGRNRRPPTDPVNCLLSYLYALLVKDLTAALFTVGFDPYVGVYHRPRFGRPALALDLAEEFRPIIADSVAIKMVNNGEARKSYFESRNKAVSLTPKGKKAVLAAYERRMISEVRHPVFKYQCTYRRVLEVQSRLLAACILGETGEYIPFETR